ncbi:MAG: selenium cofactor biosynthesis protein YqeC [Dehalococcoidia bacterium]|nr:selenium cofactor biosynthesis protein YqeC [Dehalococcoidia bacterium]
MLELGSFAGGLSYALATAHPNMTFTIADEHSDYMTHVEHNIILRRLDSRIHLTEAALDKLPFADGSFDLVLLRGAFFFIIDRPDILWEIYRVLTLGGVAFVGGGYGRSTPQSIVDAIADESRILNDQLGRRRVTLEQLRMLLRVQGLEHITRIIEEGGVWLVIRKHPLFTDKRVASLALALELGNPENIALVGGGGKTSLMFHLARELAGDGKKVISTTTTRIAKPSEKETPCIIVESEEDALIARLAQALSVHSHVTLALKWGDDCKLKGLPPEVLDRIYRLQMADCIINEADGAGCKPIKAPRYGEPVIPATTTRVIALLGLDALEVPLSSEIAFRPECINQLTGLPYGGIMTEEVIATLLTLPSGIIQNAPHSARIIPFLNKSDCVSTEKVESLAAAILARRHRQINHVVSGALLAQLSEYRVFHSQF